MVKTPRMIVHPVESVVDDYAVKRPIYDEFSAHLERLFRDLIRNAEIEVYAIEKMAKSVESFREKINRPGKPYVNPLQEVSDLVASG